MSNERYKTIRDIVRQSLADSRMIGEAFWDFGAADAVGLGDDDSTADAKQDYSVAIALAGRARRVAWSASLAMSLIRQRVAALPLEITE